MTWPPSTRNTVMTLLALMVLLLVGPLAWMAHLRSTTLEVQATVIAQKKHETSTGQTCHPTIEYEVEGTRYEHYFEWSKACCEIGDPMTVYVDRSALDQPHGSQSYENVPVGLMVLGLVLGFLALRKVRYLKRWGPFVASTEEVEPAPTAWLVTGRARAEDPFEAPHDGGSCIGYHAVVMRQRGNAIEDVFEKVALRPFDVEDDAGRLHADAKKGTIFRLERRTLTAEGPTLPEGLADLLRERGDEALLESVERWHWRVETLQDGADVQVVGTCTLREDGTKILGRRNDGPLVVSDEDAPLA